MWRRKDNTTSNPPSSPPRISRWLSALERPCGKRNPSITAQHDSAPALQAPLPPDTFISHWHSKAPPLPLAAGLILIILAFFLVPSIFYVLSLLPPSFSFFLFFFPSYEKSPPRRVHLLTRFLLLLSVPSRSSSSNLPPLPLSLSFLGTALSLISLHFPPNQVSCPFPPRRLPSSLYPLAIYSHPIFHVHHSLFFFLTLGEALCSLLPPSICVNTTPSPRFSCKHALCSATPLQSLWTSSVQREIRNAPVQPLRNGKAVWTHLFFIVRGLRCCFILNFLFLLLICFCAYMQALLLSGLNKV